MNSVYTAMYIKHMKQ